MLSLIGYNCGIIVNNLYYLEGYAPPVAYHVSFYYSYSAMQVSQSMLKNMADSLGSPFIDDAEWINSGYPIISGINYVFDDDGLFDYPIIVIPGIARSELIDADDGTKLWFELLSIQDSSLYTSTIIRMVLDINGDSINNIVPVETGYGTYNTYLNLLEELSNKYGKDNVYFFAYDWRLDNGLNAEKLSEFINDIGASKVDIIAHSMGGLVASQYIADGNAEKVQKLITLGTPYLGSPKVPYVFTSGELIVLGEILPVASEGLRRIASHMTSAYQLLPYQNADPYIAVELPGGMGEYQYVEDDFNFINNNLPMIEIDGESTPSSVRGYFLDKATAFMESIYTDDIPAIESVENYVIIGTGKPTIRASVFDASEAYVTDLIFSSDGDGTVPCWSASINDGVVTIPFN